MDGGWTLNSEKRFPWRMLLETLFRKVGSMAARWTPSFEKFLIIPMLRAGSFEGAMIVSVANALKVSKERSEGRGGLKGMLPVAILDFAAYVWNFAESKRQGLEV